MIAATLIVGGLATTLTTNVIMAPLVWVPGYDPQWHLLLLAEENVMEMFDARDGGRQRGVGVVADGRVEDAVADVLHRHPTMEEMVIDDIAFAWVPSTVSDRSRHSGPISRIAPRTTGGVKVIVWHT